MNIRAKTVVPDDVWGEGGLHMKPAKTRRSVTVIDRDKLDEEWLGQAETFEKYARRLADARNEQSILKAEFELRIAELTAAVRINPSRFGLVKVTESGIEQAVILLKEYQEAQRAMIDASHKVDLLKAVVDAMEHRKRALENLVDLFKASYFSDPRVRTTGVVERKVKK